MVTDPYSRNVIRIRIQERQISAEPEHYFFSQPCGELG
jgi:hypothetical protein